MQIIVKMDKNYGREAIYPVDDHAKKFAQLTNTKTFSRQQIEIIKHLGYAVIVEQEKL